MFGLYTILNIVVLKLSGSYCKKKWRNLRDIYVKKRRESRSSKSGQAAERANKWQFLEIMSFFDRYVEESR